MSAPAVSSRPSNDPYLDTGTRAYILIMARKNCWRIAGYGVEDLVQEGYFCYYKCKHRYVGRDPDPVPPDRPEPWSAARVGRRRERYRWLPPDNPDKLARRHFMCLFKTTFARHIANLAAKTPAGYESLVTDLLKDDDQTVEQVWEELLPAEPETASAATLLASAPVELRQLFALLVSDTVRGYRRYGRGPRAPRETSRRYYASLLGLSHQYDWRGVAQRYFLA